MKSLEVTDEQHAFVQHLREEISEQVVGKYGHVRDKDAIQFLIDNLDGDLEIEDEFDAAEMPANDLESVSYDESTESPEQNETTAQSDAVDGEETPDDGDDDSAGDGSDDDTGEDGAADDDEMLDEMMSLLETHDDKWDESSSGDYRYSVELPDGSVEEVQTKDDVRALLFKNYR
jgi:hypothetical protein